MNANQDLSESLNFSWLMQGEIAGCAAPMFEGDLDYLRSQGIAALVRLAHPDKESVMESSEIVSAGLTDLQVPVEDFTKPTQHDIDEVVLSCENNERTETR